MPRPREQVVALLAEIDQLIAAARDNLWCNPDHESGDFARAVEMIVHLEESRLQAEAALLQ